MNRTFKQLKRNVQKNITAVDPQNAGPFYFSIHDQENEFHTNFLVKS